MVGLVTDWWSLISFSPSQSKFCVMFLLTVNLSRDDFFQPTENATLEIKKQDVDRKVSHRKILEDLNRIRSKAEEVWNKIGKNFNPRKLVILR